MAKKDEAAAAPAEGAPAKKGLPVKTIGVVGALLAVEGGAVFMFARMMGGPAETHGAELHHETFDEGDRLVEIMVVKDKFPNSQSGRPWIWDVEVHVQVKARHLPAVQEILASRAAEIKTGLARIWRTAQTSQFDEPGLETLTRQVKHLLDGMMEDGPGKYMTVAPVAAAGGGGGHGAPADSHGAPAGGHDSGGHDSGGAAGHGDHGGGHGDEAEGPMIQQVLIPRCVGFPTDY